MKRAVLNSVLALALVVIVVTTIGLRADFSKRNWWYFPGMVNAVPYEPQSASTVWADGKTQQPPVAGTIAQGFPPFAFTLSPEEAARAGETLHLPECEDTTAELTRGRAVFATFCSPCHGPGGAGDGLVPKRGFPPPPSLLADHARSLKDGQIYYIITMGQVNMPALAQQVARDDRWRAVRAIRALQSAAK